MTRNFLTHWITRILSCFFVLLGLGSCGVPTDKNTSVDNLTDIVNFSLLGNITPVGSTQRVDLPVQFNNENASSLFHVSWDVDSSDPYTVVAHISTNSSPSLGSDDQIFFSTECGSDNTSYLCDSMGDQQCAITYEPDYTYLVDSSGNRILDINGNPIRLTNPDGSYIAVDHYFIRCNHGPASIDEAEITLRMQLANFPVTSLTNYIVFTFCNINNSSCIARVTTFQILDVNPAD